MTKINWHGLSLYFHHGGGLVVDGETLLVADLHLGKGEALTREGHGMLPPYDSLSVLQALTKMTSDIPGLKRVIFLGDSFHRPGSIGRLDQKSLNMLGQLQSNLHLHFVLGNHDHHMDHPLIKHQSLTMMLGNILLCHEPPEQGQLFVCGHLHPVVRVRVKGRAFRRRAFLLTDSGIFCPALGSYAGGLNIVDIAFAPWRQGATKAIMTGPDKTIMLESKHWIPDGQRR